MYDTLPTYMYIFIERENIYVYIHREREGEIERERERKREGDRERERNLVLHSDIDSITTFEFQSGSTTQTNSMRPTRQSKWPKCHKQSTHPSGSKQSNW